mgnify:CR=1 FL=1
MYTREILEEITSRNAKELAEPVAGTNGLVIAYVAERLPATAEEAGAVRAQLNMNLSRRRTRILFGEWQGFLLHAGKFKPRTAPAPAPEPIDPDLL